jgi:hypothetical protein
MTSVFLKSNLYSVLPIVYGDIGVFGTAAMSIEEDFDNVIRCYAFPIGTYSLANDEKGDINIFFREFRLTVRQLVKRFGTRDDESLDFSMFSTQVKALYDRGHLDAWIDVCHVIHPNSDYNPKGLLSNTKKFRSVYYEKGSGSSQSANYLGADDDKFLSDKGYDYFPILAPRWEVTGEDVYGTNCPGMVALGTTKALQIQEKRHAQAVEKGVNPAMIGPSSLKTQKASILPGDITYLDEREGMRGFRPVHEVNLSLSDLDNKMAKAEREISRAFFEDLFLMVATMDRNQITATEIMERKEEKLLVVGPVLEQLNPDLLDPTIDITFNIMVDQGLIPDPPEELQGVPLKVEYISIMHQAQKSAGLAGIDRFIGFTGEVAAFDPGVLDKIDSDQLIDEYAEITGVPPRIVRSDEDVEELRLAKQQAAQQQQQMEVLAQGAGVAKDLSQADMGGNNALNALIEQSEAGAAI